MAINWTHISNTSPNWLYDFISVMEGTTKGIEQVGEHNNPTIGVGFDLVTSSLQEKNAVLVGLGLTPSIVNMSPEQASALAAGSWQSIEYGYITQLRGFMVHGSTQANFDSVMFARFNDKTSSYTAAVTANLIPLLRSKFVFSSDTEIRKVFDVVLPLYEKNVYRVFPSLMLALDKSFQTSRERLVMLDLAWNGGVGMIGPKTSFNAAVLSGDRA